MRAIIIAPDNRVVIDGIANNVDCRALQSEGKHVIQWYDTRGEIEYTPWWDEPTKSWHTKPNDYIEDISPYQIYLDAWQVSNVKRLADEAKRKADFEKLQKAEHEKLRDEMREIAREEITKARGDYKS